jgi:hypothetical protein
LNSNPKPDQVAFKGGPRKRQKDIYIYVYIKGGRGREREREIERVKAPSYFKAKVQTKFLCIDMSIASTL